MNSVFSCSRWCGVGMSFMGFFGGCGCLWLVG